MSLKSLSSLLVLVIWFWSCSGDDNGGIPAPEPPRQLSEVLAENEAEIQEYLNTHYYNYPEFQSPTEDFDYTIRISEIQEGDTLEPLSNQVEFKTVRISSENLGIEGNEEDVEHKIYFLDARSGVGENPTEVDSVFLRYEGSLLDGTVFDNSITNPRWFPLLSSQGSQNFVQGFTRGLPFFKPGGNVIVNDDGTFEVEDFGSGLLIFPSALGYYNGTNVDPTYSPLVFNIQVLATNTSDHDGDGTPTKDEVVIDDEGNIAPTDSDGDGLPDYLDADIP